MAEGLVLQRVEKRFGETLAVDALDLDVRAGELTALLGPSGCGKTTLLRMIAGLEAPSGGRILLGGRDITNLPAEARRFGMVFQSFALFPHMNVAENIAYPMRIAGTSRGAREARVAELLDLVQLSGFGARRIAMLSGGQRQRVALARALAQNPSVILLDEPMSALDAKLREEMQVELRLLQQKLKITTVVVTHDQREAMTMADTIVVMNRGRCEQVGTPRAVYHEPQSRFVASFIGKANLLPATVDENGVRVGGHAIALARAPGFLCGSAVTVNCRPENVLLQPGGDAPPGANRIPATVEFVRDVGATREVFLKAGDLAFTSEIASREGDGFRVGDAVLAEWPAAAIRVFPAEAAP